MADDREFTKFINEIDLDKLHCDKIVIERTVVIPVEGEKKITIKIEK